MSRLSYITIGLVAGLIVGGVRTAGLNFATELAAFHGQRIGQRDFERAVVTTIHDRPAFTELTIYPYVLNGASSAEATRLHVVSGLYCDGQPRYDSSGKQALYWSSAYFVASVPFHAVGPGEGIVSTVQAGAEFEDVRAFLASANPVHHLPIRYAWWWWFAQSLVVWPAAGFVVVGLIWPTVLNLLTYGTCFRPRSPERHRANRHALENPPHRRSCGDAIARYRSHIPDFGIASTRSDPCRHPCSAARLLSEATISATTDVATAEKEFGVGKEDYYPTELRPERST